MQFQKFCFHLLFLVCISCSEIGDEAFLRIRAFHSDITRRRKTEYGSIFGLSASRTKALKASFKSDTLRCLEFVYSLNDHFFEEIFFRLVICPNPDFIIYVKYSIDRFEEMSTNYENIERLTHSILFSPYKSTEEMAQKFSIIKQLLKFIKRYRKEMIILRPDEEKKVSKLSNDRESLEFVMNYLSSYCPNGRIDYPQFFSTFHRLFGLGEHEYQGNFRNKNGLLLLLVTLLYRIVREEDHKIFEISHPKLPLLMGLVLRNYTLFWERELYGNYTLIHFDNQVDYFLGSETENRRLEDVLEETMPLIEKVKKSLGIEETCSISHLLEGMKSNPTKFNSNISWQLKGIDIVKDFLRVQDSEMNKAFKREDFP
jgi:hypothetical protein